MRQNLLNAEALRGLEARAMHLHPGLTALWGNMSVCEMMNHCNRVHTLVLNGQLPYTRPGFRQGLLKMLVLGLMPGLPKNVKAPTKAVLPDPGLTYDFESERATLIDGLRSISDYQGPLRQVHPIFGSLTNREWGRFLWMHTDHHLRQFGV